MKVCRNSHKLKITRACRNSHKQKVTLATGSCSEGDFDKRGVLTHLRDFDKDVRQLIAKVLSPMSS